MHLLNVRKTHGAALQAVPVGNEVRCKCFANARYLHQVLLGAGVRINEPSGCQNETTLIAISVATADIISDLNVASKPCLSGLARRAVNTYGNS